MKRAAFLAVLLISACQSLSTSGPVDIKFDRDTCQQCRMAISDRRFAAEVRGGADKKVYKFDDLGCAVRWLKAQPWAGEPTVEVWATDMKDGAWVDARKGFFIGGKTTPMGYGFGAVKAPAEGSLNFQEVSARLEKGHGQ